MWPFKKHPIENYAAWNPYKNVAHIKLPAGDYTWDELRQLCMDISQCFWIATMHIRHQEMVKEYEEEVRLAGIHAVNEAEELLKDV